jgi:hypothetical protein
MYGSEHGIFQGLHGWEITLPLNHVTFPVEDLQKTQGYKTFSTVTCPKAQHAAAEA